MSPRAGGRPLTRRACLAPLLVALAVVLRPATASVSADGAAAAPRRTYIVMARFPGADEAEPPGPSSTALVSPLAQLTRRGEVALRSITSDLAAFERAGTVTEVAEYPAFGIAVVEATEAGAARLGARPGVQRVLSDRPHYLSASRPTAALPAEVPWGRNLTEIGAPDVWSTLGTDGGGVVVATMDTGADWTHPALLASYRGRAGDHDYAWLDVTRAAGSQPYDDHGHGTHVLGLIVGRDGETTYGVAPGAEWIAVKVFDSQGVSRDSWLLRAADWLLAPTDRGGNDPRPDRAPDVINASWVLENGADPLFRPVVAAWEAAGIVPVFAAGNDESDTGTLGGILAPASYPESLAVGATVAGGAVWPLSLAGPSPFAAFRSVGPKPDVVAPGVGILSTEPGGSVARRSGTSMAVPHVAGTVALMRSVSTHLSVADVQRILDKTARDEGAPGPDEVYGWGRLDTLAAVRQVDLDGRVVGRVTMGSGGVPARIVGAARAGVPAEWSVTAGEDGAFDAAAPAGGWSVSIAAAGAITRVLDIVVERGQATQVDVALVPAARVDVRGRVTSSEGVPVVGARVDAPRAGISSRTDHGGAFALPVPVGAQTITVEAPGFRGVTRAITVTGASMPETDITLPFAPSVLLVDPDGSEDERIYPYLGRSLDQAGLHYSVWIPDDLRQTVAGAVEAALAPYEVVIWPHRAYSPGLLDARRADAPISTGLEAYVRGGGGLLLSGQDVGHYDGAGSSSRGYAPDFYRDVVGARVTADGVASEEVSGVGPFEGLVLGLFSPLGLHRTRHAPDVVQPATPDVSAVFRYDQGETAGLLHSFGAGRLLYLAFCPESAGPPAAVGRLLDRAIDVLAPVPRPDLSTSALDLAPARLPMGGAVAATLVLRDGRPGTEGPLTATLQTPAGFTPDGPPTASSGTISGGLRQAAWAGRVSAAAPVTVSWTGSLPAVAGTEFPFAAAVRPEGGAVTRRSVRALVGGPDVAASRFHVTPGEAAREYAFVADLDNTGPVTASVALTLTLPPGVEATTPGWTGDLPPASGQQVRLALRALQGAAGPRDVAYALTDGFAPAAPITGVATMYVPGPDLLNSSIRIFPGEASSGDRVMAILRLDNAGDLPASLRATADLPPSLAVDPSSVVSSAGVPSVSAAELTWDVTVAAGEAESLRFEATVARSVTANTVLSVPVIVEGAPAPDLNGEVLVNRLRLAGAALAAGPPTRTPGSRVAYTLTVPAEGAVDARGVSVDMRLPPGLVDVEPGPDLVRSGASALRWQGRISAGRSQALTWTARVADSVTSGAVLPVAARVEAPGVQAIELRHGLRVADRDLSASRKAASPSVAGSGAIVHFLLRPVNAASDSGFLEAVDALPETLDLVPGTLSASTGGAQYDPGTRSIGWAGELGANTGADVRFDAVLLSPDGATNVMVVTDDAGDRSVAWARIAPLRDRIYLPALTRAAPGAEQWGVTTAGGQTSVLRDSDEPRGFVGRRRAERHRAGGLSAAGRAGSPHPSRRIDRSRNASLPRHRRDRPTSTRKPQGTPPE